MKQVFSVRGYGVSVCRSFVGKGLISRFHFLHPLGARVLCLWCGGL